LFWQVSLTTILRRSSFKASAFSVLALVSLLPTFTFKKLWLVLKCWNYPWLSINNCVYDHCHALLAYWKSFSLDHQIGWAICTSVSSFSSIWQVIFPYFQLIHLFSFWWLLISPMLMISLHYFLSIKTWRWSILRVLPCDGHGWLAAFMLGNYLELYPKSIAFLFFSPEARDTEVHFCR
jgi:hypothetical protein